ncbi:glycoside hydrolase family 68 protein [Zymobacter sp. IVIA_5232.4 C2]|uniref:glycoside hydrolase family 68 protein n=1 Tax=Zymobacter sp. IVIA_5232.4 C2 TaxID=3394855 RepID=UPI0039C49FC6
MKEKTKKAASTVSHWTREAASKIKATAANTFPPFDPSKLRPLMPGYHVWDSWFVLSEAGHVAHINGYRVLIALVRPAGLDQGAGEKIAYFYSKDGKHYKAGGFLFEQPLYEGVREWSGSTILRRDGNLQTFYTVADGREYAGGIWQTGQRFATAIQSVIVEESGDDEVLKFAKPKYHALLKEPDGLLYETSEQAAKRELQWPTAHTTGSDQTDNFCFRDPKFFLDAKTGKAYIFFEANTGQECCPAGSVKREYIGSAGYDADYTPAVDDLKANGCVGVIELTNDDYTYGEFKKPWLTSNLVTDEIERINVVPHNGHIYLFVAAHGNKCTLVAGNEDLKNRDYMLGFRAKEVLGTLEPLNESGIVLQQKSLGAAYGGQETNQQYVYSWLIVPSDKPGVLDCISYANYSQDTDGQIKPIKTAGPTVEMRISGLESHITNMKYDILPVAA